MPPQLLTVLKEVLSSQLRLQFCKQILARNMDFSPAWLLALLHQANHDTHHQVNIDNLGWLVGAVGMQLSQHHLGVLFGVIDWRGRGWVDDGEFVEELLPRGEALRRGVAKRVAQGLEMSGELRYALKRLFGEMLDWGVRMGLWRVQGDEGAKVEHSGNVTEDEIKEYFDLYQCFPTESEVKLLAEMINSGRLKNVSAGVLHQAITNTKKQLKQLTEIKPILNSSLKIQGSISSYSCSSPIKLIRQSPKRQTDPHNQQTKKVYSTPTKNIKQPKHRNIEDTGVSSPPLRINRTTSILQPQLSESIYRNPEQIPHFRQDKIASPYRHVPAGSTFPAPQPVPEQQMIRNLFPRGSSQRPAPARTDIAQLLMSNNEMQQQIEQYKRQNLQRLLRLNRQLQAYHTR